MIVILRGVVVREANSNVVEGPLQPKTPDVVSGSSPPQWGSTSGNSLSVFVPQPTGTGSFDCADAALRATSLRSG